MKRRGTPLGLEITRAVLLGCGVLLVAFMVAQLNAIEGRMIESNRKVTMFSEKLEAQADRVKSLERLVRRGGLAVAGTQKAQTTEKREWLHPEVENYLVPDPYQYLHPEAEDGGKVTRWYGSDPKGLNFTTENASDLTEKIKVYVHNSLATQHYKDPGTYAPDLAERIEITDDYKTYTIYLRKGVLWHPPAVDWADSRYDWLKGDHEFTSEDVKFAIDLILNPQVECSHLRNYYQDVQSVEIIDKYTLQVKWKVKTYNSISFTLGVYPVPKFLYAYDEDGEAYPEATLGLRFNEHWYNQKAIGTGPYRFVSWEQGVGIKFTRNEDYFDEKPAIKEIQWLIFPDVKTNLLKIKSKELDFGALRSADYTAEIVEGADDSPFKDGRIEHKFWNRSVYTYIGWNNDHFLFTDKRVRKALALSLDRQSIVDNILQGLGTQVTGPFFFKSPYCDSSIQPLPYDLEAAKALLAEAGWEDTDGDGILDKEIDGERKPFTFTLLLWSGSPTWSALAAIYKEALFKVGIRMNTTEAEWSLMQKRMEDREFEAYSGAWSMPWESDPYQIWHSSQADQAQSSNRIGFRNKEADALIEELRRTFEKEDRIKLYHKIHRILFEEQPYCFFYSPKSVFAWWAHVKNVDFSEVRPADNSRPWYLQEGGAP